MKKIYDVLSWITTLLSPRKIAVLIIAAGVIIAIFIQHSSTKSTSFDTYSVVRGDISETITNSGNVTTNGNATVFSPSTGIVEEVYIQNGVTVTQGQNLLKVKSTATDIERANALAAYQTAQSAVNTAKQSKISNQSLLEAGRKSVIDASIALEQMRDRRNVSTNNPATAKPYTLDEVESITSAYTSAKKAFESLENKYTDSDSAISAAQSNSTAKWLAYQATVNGIIKAPIAGTVMNVAVESGDSVVAQVSPDISSASIRPLLRISTLENLSIKVSLSEIDIAKVNRGQKATVVFDALPDKSFQATVSRVDTVGSNTNSVVTYDAYVSFAESDDRIRPGMTATVAIQTVPKTSVLLVPNIALKKDNNDITVQVQDGKSTISKTVRIGIKNSNQSEVLSGLIEGEKIIIPKSR